MKTNLLKRMRSDLTKKDSHAGITLSYGWLANQLSHFGLGFFTVLVFDLIGINKFTSYFIALVFWFLYECVFMLLPLKKIKNHFAVDWNNIINDTVTDILFMYYGATFCLLYFGYNPYVMLTILVLTPILHKLSVYWYKIKIAQDYAGFPIQKRLSQCNVPLKGDDISTIKKFITKCDQEIGNHLIIKSLTDKEFSSLGIAIANECVIKKNIGCYIDSSNMFDENISEKIENTNVLLFDKIGANNIDQFIEKNKQILHNKNIIWVLAKNEMKETFWRFKFFSFIASSQKIRMIFV